MDSSHSAFGTQSSDRSADANNDATGIADRAKNAAGVAGDKLAEVGSAVRDSAGNAKTSIADALQSGAERLRQQSAGGAGATGAGAAAISDDSRISQASKQLAGGMQGASDWLRDADLDGLKSGLERQVKEYPGRSLAVAIGLGYLLGKAFRD